MEFDFIFESDALATTDECAQVEVFCEAEIEYDGPSDSMLNGVEVLKLVLNEKEIKMSDLPEAEQKKVQARAEAIADNKFSDWVSDIEADMGDRAYEEMRDRMMDEE